MPPSPPNIAAFAKVLGESVRLPDESAVMFGGDPSTRDESNGFLAETDPPRFVAGEK